MANFFQVDLSVLGRFSDALDSSVTQMAEALEALEDASRAGELGTPALNQAAHDFQHAWHYGMTQIRSKAQEVGEHVDQTLAAYEQVEAAATADMRTIQAELGVGA